MARSLGLDVGNRRIGVAVSDTLKVIARPVDIIDRKHQGTASAIQRVVEYVQEHQPDEIIVGYPFNADGTAGPQAHSVEQFTALLRARVGVPVRYYDERYSTGEAQEIISGKKRKDQDQHDDAVAAAVILQRYLDENRVSREEDETI